MAKTPRRAPAGSNMQTVGMTPFKTRLYQLRTAKGLSMSDLARSIWGTFTDARGYEVARNKDRISRWEKGDQTPEPQNLELLAKALDVTIDELAPDLTAKRIDQSDAAISMTMVAGQPDRVHLVVNTLTSLDIASKIIAMLSADPMMAAAR
jgi:transcriptional regulator with XRE-family HTH domain